MARSSAIELFRREVIPRHDNEPYLERLIIFRCKWFGIFLHRFIGGDDECHHDHPWNFWTWLVRGGYTEWTPDAGPVGEKATWYPAGSVLYRPAEWVHRVDIGKQRSVISLVVHGPKARNWGFWIHKWLDWIHHSKYNYTRDCA